jgi:hypothetical protein
MAATLLAAACSTPIDSGPNSCAAAADHLAACSGGEIGFDDAECEEEEVAAADALLELSCNQIAPPANHGKADFWETGNPLCTFMVGAKGASEGTLCCFDHNCEGSANGCFEHHCRPKAPEGGDCHRNGHCQSGLVCGADDTCGQPVGLGGSCEGSSQCSAGLACIGSACALPSTDGGPCDDGDDHDCEIGHYCDAGSCAPKQLDGESCTHNTDCILGLVCVAGSCSERGGLGDSCDVGELDCDLGLYCIDGSCADEPGLGDTCESKPTFMCGDGNICWQGTCEPEHGEGEACESMFDCTFGLFCVDGSCSD